MTDQGYADRFTTYRVDSHRTAWRQVDTEGVVLDLATSVYFGLNRAAGVLWPRLLQGATHARLVRALVDSEPSLDKQQAAIEITAFLATLDTQNLLLTDPA